MIAVDTNVLVRLIVDDDQAQHQAARRFFAQRSSVDPAYISLVVIVELAWLLDKTYNYSAQSVADAILAFLASPDFKVEGHKLVEEAVNMSRQPKVDLVDVLIAGLAILADCRATVTFDRTAAKRIPGMELLA